jgi:hypothetical protein
MRGAALEESKVRITPSWHVRWWAVEWTYRLQLAGANSRLEWDELGSAR